IKRKGLSLEQESAKKHKISEEVTEEAKSSNEVPKRRSYWKITRLGGSSASYQFFIDLLKHLDKEDLNQLWRLVKETLSNRPSTSDKEMELWVELSRLYEPDHEDQLWTHTQNFMHAPVEWKLYDSCGVHQGRIVGNKIRKAFPLPVIEFPLAEELPTASEERCHYQKKSKVATVKIVLLSKKKESIQYPRFIKLVIANLMKKFPNIPQRIDEDYHSIKDNIPLVSIYTTENVTVREMLIPDEFLTDEIRATDDYKEYETIFVGVDVPMNQPQLVVSTQEMHRSTPRAHRTPTLTTANEGDKYKQSYDDADDFDDRDDDIHSQRHDDHQEDDAPPEGRKE
nr:hypothetical protein [Tanacetum cinerariifolium]